jgi:hypothetical protein
VYVFGPTLLETSLSIKLTFVSIKLTFLKSRAGGYCRRQEQLLSGGRQVHDTVRLARESILSDCPMHFVCGSPCESQVSIRGPQISVYSGLLQTPRAVPVPCVSCREGCSYTHTSPCEIRHACTVCVLQGGVCVGVPGRPQVGGALCSC